MRTYEVYRHPTDGMQAVKKGVSWPAFLFNVFWALLKRLWPQAAGLWFAGVVYKSLTIFLAQEAPALGSWVEPLLLLGIMTFAGLRGNEWVSERLSARGYRFLETVEAKSASAAVALVSIRDTESIDPVEGATDALNAGAA